MQPRMPILSVPAVVAVLLVALAATTVSTQRPRFYRDDPLAREPESRDASGASPSSIALFYEYAFNLFATARHRASGLRAQNVNTIDEVPDSGWLTNRIGAAAMTPGELAGGGITGAPPAPAKWTILREKSAGTNPGFTAKDANGETWFLQFDAPSSPGASSAAVAIANKLFWALGYNQVEIFITTFDAAHAQIDPRATVVRASGARVPYGQDDMNAILERAARSPDGTYRATAGRLIPGTVLGPFRYSGTRPDDPNDTVPHEHRRELRALRVFGAWTNLVDLKAGNTLDALVVENGHSVVKHYLQDVGSTFGTANNEHEWDQGWEYFFESEPTKKRFLSFGFALSPWQTAPYTHYTEVGVFEGDRFDPTTWRPQTPTTPYMEMRADDAFWAARRVAAFTDEMIRAAVHVGQFRDPAAEQYLATVLMKRRDKIARAYLPAINPIVDPRLDASGTLTFHNAAVEARAAGAPSGYRATWLQFDNATGTTRPIGESSSVMPVIRAPGALPAPVGSFVQVDVAADSTEWPAWKEPVHLHFRRTNDSWQLVGLQRLE
jgi:hypothetical protein